MIQSKAIDILQSMSGKEFKQFGKYLDSAFLTSNKKMKKLYNHLAKFYPLFDSVKLTKESVFKSAYGEQKFSDIKTRKLLSDLYKEAEKFIIILHIEQDKILSDKILLAEFDIRKLDSLFHQKFTDLNISLSKNIHHYDYFLEKHLAEWRNVIFHLERGMQEKIALNVFSRTEYLIFYFLSDFMLSMQDIDSNKNKFNITKEINLASEFIKNLDLSALYQYISKNNFEGKDIIIAYYLAYLAFKNFDKEKYYYDFKKHVFVNIDNYGQGIQRTLVIYLINYCIRKKRKKQSNEIKLELNENYNLYISKQLYKLSGENYVRTDLFIDITANYLSVNKIKEAEDFITNNIHNTYTPHRRNIRALCNAAIEFEKGNFGASLRYAASIKTNSQLFKNRVKILNLKNHFELKNHDTAIESSISFKRSVNTDSNLNDYNKEKILEFLKNYNLLWEIYESDDRNNAAKNLASIQNSSETIESDWLTKKFGELIRKNKN